MNRLLCCVRILWLLMSHLYSKNIFFYPKFPEIKIKIKNSKLNFFDINCIAKELNYLKKELLIILNSFALLLKMCVCLTVCDRQFSLRKFLKRISINQTCTRFVIP